MGRGGFALAVALALVAVQAASKETQVPVSVAGEATATVTSSTPVEAVSPSATESTTPPAPLAIPMNTNVMIQLDAAVSSRSAARGDMFAISLAEPVMLNGVEVIPAGITGEGQVVHSAGTGFGGRAGELIVAARYLMWGDRRILLRGMRISTAGRNNTAEALALGQLIPLGGLFVTGTSVDLPVGQIAVARFAEDVPIGDGPATPVAIPVTADATSVVPEAAPVTEATPISTNSNEVQQGGTQ